MLLSRRPAPGRDYINLVYSDGNRPTSCPSIGVQAIGGLFLAVPDTRETYQSID
jgi:hypothetical protein